MLEFILKFSACLSIFMVFYKLVLERANMHQFKRFYLLGVVVISAIIPLITFTEYIEPQFIMGSFLNPIDEAILFPMTEEIIETPIDYTPIIIWSLYGLGVLVFSIKFALNLKQIILKIKNNPKQKTSSFISVLLNDLIAPHTFFSYIFLNKTKFENNQIPQEVLLHEETHATQKHSLDILFIELFQIIFWFNPLVYFLKKDIKLNHEFLADQAVINEGTDTKNYQNLLLAFSSNVEKPSLAHAINYSLIKKRFTVMKSKTSKQSFWIRSLFIFPILAILIYSFSSTKQVEKEIAQDVLFEEQPTNKIEATKAMMEEYETFISKTKDTRQVRGEQYKRAVAIYNLMSIEQKQSVEKYVELPFLNVSKTRPSVKPTNTLLNSWKNKSTYAVWIDGKVIDNSVLNNYSSSDFVHYSQSKVYKNARSERFPQPFQVNIYTKSHYVANFENRDIKAYKIISKKYTDALNIWLKEDRIDNSELRILKAQADKVYNDIAKEKQNAYNLKPTPPIPSTYKANDNQQETTPKSEQEIKVLKTNKNKNITLLEHWYITIDNKRYYYPYKKGDLKKYYDKYGNEARLNIVKEYTKKYNSYEALRTEKPHYINKSVKEQKEMDVLFSDLGGMYFRMIRENKVKVKRPISPLKSYAKITLHGKTYYKKYKELTAEEKATLPPPPPPPIPANATPQQKAKYEKAYKYYRDAIKKYSDNNPPPPPPTKAPQYKNGKKKTLNEIIEDTPKGIESGYEMLENGETHYYTVYNEQKTYYNKDGYITDKNGVVLPPPPPAPISPKVIEEQVDKTKNKASNEKTGWMKIDGDTYYYLVKNNKKTIFNRWGQRVNEKGEPLEIKEVSTSGNSKHAKGGPNPDSFTFSQNSLNKSTKRTLTISVSKKGEYAISKDETYRNFKPISLVEIEALISKLSSNEIKNTFVFTKANDLKKFRSKPSKSEEYQNDIEIYLIKSNPKSNIFSDEYSKEKGYTYFEFPLDNSGSEIYKPQTKKLARIFKKHGITNITL